MLAFLKCIDVSVLALLKFIDGMYWPSSGFPQRGILFIIAFMKEKQQNSLFEIELNRIEIKFITKDILK